MKLIVCKKSDQSYKTRCQVEQNALVQGRFCDQAKEVLGETIEDKDKKIELNDKRINFSW